MIDLLIRRREMGLPPTPEPLPDYVSDGLVLWLDGKVKGSTTGAWTDLVNGLIFTQTGSGVTFNSNNVQFVGSGALVNSDSSNMPKKSVGTIEICFRDANFPTSGNQVPFYSGAAQGIGFRVRNNSIVQINTQNTGTQVKDVPFTPATAITFSISNSRALENFMVIAFSSTSNYVTRTQSNVVVGGSGRGSTGAQDVFVGKIHSLRVYNRHLTEEEVLHNQAIDNTRFNLGLTINS